MLLCTWLVYRYHNNQMGFRRVTWLLKGVSDAAVQTVLHLQFFHDENVCICSAVPKPLISLPSNSFFVVIFHCLVSIILLMY